MRFILAFAIVCGTVSGAELYYTLPQEVEPTKPEYDYPTLYQSGNVDGVIVVVGAKGCRNCGNQLRAIPGVRVTYRNKQREIKSTTYRVMYVDVTETDPKNESDNAPPWGDLLDGEGKGYPTTLIVVGGEVVKSFPGYTRWYKLKADAKPCKIEEKKRRFELFERKDVPRPVLKSRFGRSVMAATEAK